MPGEWDDVRVDLDRRIERLQHDVAAEATRAAHAIFLRTGFHRGELSALLHALEVERMIRAAVDTAEAQWNAEQAARAEAAVRRAEAEAESTERERERFAASVQEKIRARMERTQQP